MDDDDAPLYTVGQVAEILGVQAAFLRRLDSEDVVQPARSQGGQRRYTRREVRDVERVVALTVEGVTLPGVRRILSLEARVSELESEVASLRNPGRDHDRAFRAHALDRTSPPRPTFAGSD